MTDLRAAGCLVKKMHGNIYQPGMPDLYVLWYGSHCWVECKRPPKKEGGSDGGKLRPEQLIVFAELVGHGAVIWVGDNAEWLVDHVMRYMKAANQKVWAELSGAWRPTK